MAKTVSGLTQHPLPGTRRVRFRGDVERFRLELERPQSGTAFLRTTLGHAGEARDEIIRGVERDEAALGHAWFDLPMRQTGAGRFEVRVPLTEVGHFEAKCFFLPRGQAGPVWPEGSNVAVNVAPAQTCSANILYNAFVRQFGPGKHRRRPLAEDHHRAIDSLDRGGYAVIPPSGTFRDLIAELDFIVGTLGCRFLQLLPINPTPTTYGRMGRFGSPYAALGFTAVDPALAVFDPKATPLEQFGELVDEVHRRGAYVLLDLAINHTGWAAALHETHPEWLVRNPDGTIENPGAWGVRWEDLTKLDYRHRRLWHFMANVFLTWCHRGVDGFRCDAGYMIPGEAWQYIIARVRREYPDTLFFLEGLGGKISVTRDLLNRSDFNWAYSELFQNYDRAQVSRYLSEALDISASDGLLIHFAETHDNNRLASRSRTYARMRTALTALCSVSGGFAFANGVEWFAEEKINVHDAPSLNWGAEPNQVADIRRLTALLKHHPVFFDRSDIRVLDNFGGNSLILLRHHRDTDRHLLILANLDDTAPQPAAWDPSDAPSFQSPLFDLLSGETVAPDTIGDRPGIRLPAGRVLCLSPNPDDLPGLLHAETAVARTPDRIRRQRLRAKVLDVLAVLKGFADPGDLDLDAAADRLSEDPAAFCRERIGDGAEPRVVLWRWPEDVRREVMLPPGHFLLVRADSPFRVRMRRGSRCLSAEESLPTADGGQFALLSPPTAGRRPKRLKLTATVFAADGCRRDDARVMLLPKPGDRKFRCVRRRPELLNTPLTLLGTNRRGGMMRAAVSWAALRSRYDALLAANLNPDVPVDRWMLLARMRAWIVYQAYSQEIGDDCLDGFCWETGGTGTWRFRIPTGQGSHIALRIGLAMADDRNAVRLVLYREPANQRYDRLVDEQPVQVILRPDIEDRSFHDTVKAYLGPEHLWPDAIQPIPDGFVFSPAPDRRLTVRLSGGAFVPQPEWYYMVHRPLEAQRGQDPDSDLFGPGYLTAALAGDRCLELTASAEIEDPSEPIDTGNLAERTRMAFDAPVETDLSGVLTRALDRYVVRRGRHRTVIAGYPWFLDWGRDTLIVLRGLIADGQLRTARDILAQFGAFEASGTLPNMIRGTDASNRDTSDAPLWFVAACTDLMAAEGDRSLFQMACGDRSLGQVLVSIGTGLTRGTPNGIRMDPDSALLFSPAHFTWMDTDHPAGTPRQGYPVEIQALWTHALDLLGEAFPETAPQRPWADLAETARRALADLYFREGDGYLADCLHAAPGQPAASAIADDALRPNQLFAVTFGAVSDPDRCRRILESCASLLIPGAVRSLADRPVAHPLEIRYRNRLLGDPKRPYRGRYEGDEDSQRKPAYHNGTAWTWLLPTFCEAWVRAFGPSARETARAYLVSGLPLLQAGCMGHLPEILDGDAPHTPRGCDAQAWGISELLRVLKRLDAA